MSTNSINKAQSVTIERIFASKVEIPKKHIKKLFLRINKFVNEAVIDLKVMREKSNIYIITVSSNQDWDILDNELREFANEHRLKVDTF